MRMDKGTKPSPAPQPAGEHADSDGEDRAGQRKGKLHRQAVEHLRGRIMRGVLQPGERLLENRLCEELSISRTPVREALRTLAAEGLVDLLPNRSVVVSRLRAADINHLYLVCGALEGLAGELACQHITDAQIAEVGELFSGLVDMHQKRDRVAYMELNFQIHRRVVEIAANPVLLAQWHTLMPRVERARSLANHDPKRWSDALLEHSKMFAALAGRNGPLLGQLSRDHFLHLQRSQKLSDQDAVDTESERSPSPKAKRAQAARTRDETPERAF